MRPVSGTYALVLRSAIRSGIAIGRWGTLELRRGYYVYVGSAFGPGGVRARVGRHCRGATARHWHVDYLREFTSPVAVWCGYAPVRREHHCADAFGRMPGMRPVSGFGCSDCRCAAHLFYSTKRPQASEFTTLAGDDIEICRCTAGG